MPRRDAACRARGGVVSACRVVAVDKPTVWRDEPGNWRCDQNVACESCNAVWTNYLAEAPTWAEAMAASADARPIVDTG